MDLNLASANGTPNYYTNFPSLGETEPEFQVFWDIINIVDVLCVIDTIGSPLTQGYWYWVNSLCKRISKFYLNKKYIFLVFF